MPDMPMPPFAFAAPEWLDEVSSTNDMLRERLAGGKDAPAGTVVAALRQTRGRGRRGNVWQSSMGGDLTFSFVWAGDKSLEDAATLPVACGLAVRDFLALSQIGVKSLCKWPNDVLVDGKKICGILTEAVSGRNGARSFIVGIGVNIRTFPERDEALGRLTASLERLTGRADEPQTLLPLLLDRLADRITLWQYGGFAAIRPDVDAGLWGIGQTVTAKTPSGPVAGVMIGLGDKGELLLRDAEGSVFGVSSVSAIQSIADEGYL